MSITHINTQYDFFTELVPLAALAASNNLAVLAAPIIPTLSATLQICYIETTSIICPKRQRALFPSTALASHEHYNLHYDLRQLLYLTQELNVQTGAMGLP